MGLQVAKAKETTEKIDAELKDLQATLANIEEARPFEDLTVRIRSRISFYMAKMCPCSQAEDVGKAHPRIVEAVETMVKKGKWTVPGEWLLQLAFTTDFCSLALKVTRRSSATSRLCKCKRPVRRSNRSRRRLTFLREAAHV